MISDDAKPPKPPDGAGLSGPVQPGMDVKAVFASGLRGAMERKGWSISETARRASQLLTDGGWLSRAHVWHYVRGKALPRAKYLQALSLALEVSFEELIQSSSSKDRGTRAPGQQGSDLSNSNGTVRVQDNGDGTVLLELTQHLPWETAIQILRLAKGLPEPVDSTGPKERGGE